MLRHSLSFGLWYTEKGPMSLASYGDGSLPVINGSGAAEAVSLTNQDYCDMSNIAVTNPAPTTARRRGLVATADDGTVHEGISTRDVEVYDVADETTKDTQSGVFIASAGILVNGTENASRYDAVQASDNMAHGCDGGGIKVRGGQMENRGDRTHIWGNNISHVGRDEIIVSYGASPLIESNLCGVLDHGKYPWTARIWVLGCRGAAMRFNAVHDSPMPKIDSAAFGCGWGNESICTVEYNYSHDNAGGIFLNCNVCGTPGGARQIM